MAPDLHRYLLPVRDLTVTREWVVGRVRFLPAGATRPLIAKSREGKGRSSLERFDQHIDGVAARFDESTIAEVTSAEPRDACGHVADALAVLRLLQHQLSPVIDTHWQTFGLPGQVSQWDVEFIDLTTGPGGGFFCGRAAGMDVSPTTTTLSSRRTPGCSS
jgi:hypothetical protein